MKMPTAHGIMGGWRSECHGVTKSPGYVQPTTGLLNWRRELWKMSKHYVSFKRFYNSWQEMSGVHYVLAAAKFLYAFHKVL